MLVTLDELKENLGIEVDTYDDFLEQQIALVTETIEAYCRRKFEFGTYTQTFYAKDYEQRSKKLILGAYPVKDIVSIEADDEAITDYRVQKQVGIMTKDDAFVFDETLVVEFTGGYETIPATIKDVIFSIVGERYSKKSAGVALSFGSDVQRVSIPGTISIDFDYSLSNNDRKTPFGMILGNYLNILDYYRSDQAIIGSSRLIYIEFEEEA